MNLLGVALKYAGGGFFIFPVVSNYKTPLTPHGCLDATTDPNVIRDWWVRWPEANIGLATGEKSNIVAVDYDVKKGKPGLKTYDSFQCRFDINTLTAQTPSGGIHQFFQYVSGLHNAVDRFPGVDVRTNGGYVLLAPSIVDGKPYKWTHVVSPAEMPAGLIASLQKPKAPAVRLPHRVWTSNRLTLIERARRYVNCVPGAIQGQAGDVSTYKLACKLIRGFDLTDGEALALLCCWNLRCVPPWSESDLISKITSARRNGKEPFGARLEMR
jgi:hypothetical protein